MSSFQLPSFLHGPRSVVLRRVKAEGRRCAKQYALDGSFPQPRELLPVAPGEAVFTDELIDFEPKAPAWRFYGVSELLMSLTRALREQVDYRVVRDAHEAAFRETAWGALFYATAELAPYGAEHTGLRLAGLAWTSGQLTSRGVSHAFIRGAVGRIHVCEEPRGSYRCSSRCFRRSRSRR